MIIASLPFVLVISTFYGGVKELFNDVQAIWFLRILGVFILFMIWNNYTLFDTVSENIRQTAFNVTSVMTGTGYSSLDYSAWGNVTIIVMLIAMMLGGGAGSTTCGLKMFRLKILYETVTIGFRRLIHPNGVIIPYYGKSVIEPETSATVISYIAVFLITGILFAIVYASFGYDIVTAFSASFSALSCLGPGLGDIIGPNSTYKDVTDSFKWVFIFEMILGRLEIFTVLMLLTPSFWND
jgi:trk system potassium uptake protein TrkH